MKILAWVSLLASTLIFNACGNSTSGGGNASVTIAIPSGATSKGSAAFGTNPLHVAVGATVAWVNNDSVTHTATSSGNFNTGNISPGSTSSVVTFSSAGTYNYNCSIHTSMTGQIIVP